MSVERPPALAAWLAARRLSPEWRDYVLGDLDEEFQTRCAASIAAARRWYWRQALLGLVSPVPKPARHAQHTHTHQGQRMSFLPADFALALRVFRRAPGYAAAVVLVLALGIGATTAIFTIVNAALLRPLPYEQPDRLVRIFHTPPQDTFPGMKTFAVSPANFYDWQRDATSFEAMAIYGYRQFTLTGLGAPEARTATAVGHGFFDIVRMTPLMGRTFSPDEDRPGNARVVVVSEAFWRSRLGADPNALSRALTLNGERYAIAGVMPAAFSNKAWGATAPDLWVPIALTDEERLVRDNHNDQVLARLKPGVALASAQSELDTISARLARAYPDADAGWGAIAIPLPSLLVGDVKSTLQMLLAAVGLLLLIACANVANLMFTRALSRGKEIAIRSALGAGRRRVVQQLLVEGLVLSLAGGLAGLAVANVALRASSAMLADQLPQAANLSVDWRVLVFVILTSMLAGVLAGGLPALRAGRANLTDSLRQAGRADTGAFGLRTRRLLIVGEVAMSLMLLAGAGIMIRSLSALRNVDAGFTTSNVLTMNVTLPETKYKTPAQRTAFFDKVLADVRALPGVEVAGLVSDLPTQGGSVQPVVIDGAPPVSPRDQPTVNVRAITPGYLRAMKIPAVRGRDFDAADQNVVLVSEAAAKLLWHDADPIGGHTVLPLMDKTLRQVVGIVGDVKQGELSEKFDPTIYFYTRERDWAWLTLVMRTAIEPDRLAKPAVAAIQAIDPEQPVEQIRSMSQVIDTTMTSRRFSAQLMAVFAALALLLAAVGIYTVLAFIVRGRSREIGIRSALGAQTRDLIALVVAEGMAPAAIGIAAGAAGAFAAAGVLRSLVFGVSPTDPATLIAAAVALAAVALLASAVPAYRASRVDPLKVLRD